MKVTFLYQLYLKHLKSYNVKGAEIKSTNNYTTGYLRNTSYLITLNIYKMFLCVSITPFDNPVVPLEHKMAAARSLQSPSKGWKLVDLFHKILLKVMCLSDTGDPNTTISFRNPTEHKILSIFSRGCSEQNIIFGFDMSMA